MASDVHELGLLWFIVYPELYHNALSLPMYSVLSPMPYALLATHIGNDCCLLKHNCMSNFCPLLLLIKIQGIAMVTATKIMSSLCYVYY